MDESLIRLKYVSGAVAYQPLFPAAVAVIRQKADVITAEGEVVPPTRVVICRRLMIPQMGCQGNSRFAKAKLRLGAVVDVIDPGPSHHSVILPWSTEHAMTALKECCFSVGICASANNECGSCCNNPHKK